MADRSAAAGHRGAGWYTDPGGTDETYRWWDGRSWTDWLTRDPHSPPPARPPRRTQTPDPAILHRRRRRWIAALSGALAVLLLLAGASAWGMARNAQHPTAVVTPSPLGPPVGDSEIPLLVAETDKFTVKGRWYCENPFYNRTEVAAAPGLFLALSSADDGRDTASQVVMLVGVVDPAVPGGSDASEGARALAVEVADRLLRQVPDLTGGEPRVQPWPQRGNAALVTIERAQPTGDRAVAVNFQVMLEVWPDGTRVAWLGMVQAQGPANSAETASAIELGRLDLQESLDSIR